VTARSIILESFSGFRALIQLGRIIGHIQGFRRVVPVWGFCSLRRRLQCLGSILQEEAIIALIYHWEEFSSIWGSSSSGGSNPWSPLSSAGRTSSLRVRLNPSFVLERSSSIAAFGRLTLYLREHFVCNSYYCLEAI
jgi:hypothetical protein